jgi:glyoxylase-like metal-dependent hydrolase (beta-lactamase superfamily II)
MLELASEDERLIERLRSAPRRTAEPARRIELKWGIVLHPTKTRPLPPATHTNTYLVGDAEMALIDPGSDDPEELAALDQLIGMLAADGRRVACVLATHAHPDHVAGIAAVRARYRAPVLAHALTAQAVAADRALEDGELVPLSSKDRDWSLRAIHTPGHARGHLCFLHEGTRSLFCGDHIPGAGTVIVDPPEGDMADYLASLERLLELPIETLFPGHGSPRGAAHARVRELIAHRRAREARVLATLAPDPSSLAELVEIAYDDTPRELWPYAERSLLAHLLKLEREGRAIRDGEAWRAVTW